MTNSTDGCFRWPVRADPSAPGRLRLGPPERLPFNEGSGTIAVSRDGPVMVQAMYAGYGEQPYAGGWILHADRPGEPRRVAAGVSMGDADISPDGRWAAFGVHNTHVLVFETATGREVFRTPEGENTNRCRFTPDGRWLATEADGGRVYAVGTWVPAAQLGPGQLRCISPDSRLAVLTMNEGCFRLVEVETGRELAQLEDPDRHNGRGAWLAATFTPDGTKLVAPAKDGLRVWDLRAIRRELAVLGLDWVAPAYPPEEKPPASPPPLTVEVVGAQLLDPTTRLWWHVTRSTWRLLDAPDDATARRRRATAAGRIGWLWLAAHDYTALLDRDPGDKSARMLRGRIALYYGRHADALADFDDLLRRDPASGPAWYWRIRTLMHVGRHPEALADLERLILRFPRDPDLYRLRGLCHTRLGDTTRADADARTAADLVVDDPYDANLRAWRLVTGPVHLRDPDRALALAERAVRLAPLEWDYHNTLGVVYYRIGRYAEAVKYLSASLEHSSGQSAGYDLYTLALCHHRLGDWAKARDYFDRGVRWHRQAVLTVDQDLNMNALRREAAKVLDVPTDR